MYISIVPELSYLDNVLNIKVAGFLFLCKELPDVIALGCYIGFNVILINCSSYYRFGCSSNWW